MTQLPWPGLPGDDDGPGGADAAVRHAVAADATSIARVQADSWRNAYGQLVDEAALDSLLADAAAAWTEAIAAQEPRRHVLVATAGVDLVGVATLAGSADPDLDAGVDAELGVLVIDPERTRQGHASRLLAAAVDLLRSDDFTHLFTWVPSQDDPLRRLLVESGWAADGARRTLETEAGTEVHQLRLHTDLRTD